MRPFFTIITATFNAAGHLPRLLDSLASQTCRDFELVIQDGGSTDATAHLAEDFRNRLPFLSFVSEPDSGIYDAWNKALARARGEWVLFLGADDALYNVDVLQKTRQRLLDAAASARDTPICFACGGVAATSAEGIPFRYISGVADGWRASLRANDIPTPFPGLFIHKTLLHPLAFDASLRIAGDFEFLCRTWSEDKGAVRLPYLVSSMFCGGVSDQPKNAAMLFREVTNATDKYYCNAWTAKRRYQYIRSLAASFLWRYFPRQADAMRKRKILLGKEKRFFDATDKSLPNFSPSDMPIFIISYNRLYYLETLIEWLERHGFANITIVDNNSTYEPLIRYLESSPHRVFRLDSNLGHLAVWRCGLFNDILAKEYYVVTDPDVLPVEDCPEDILMQCYNYLMAYPRITKCGFSLYVDDLPEHYPLRDMVLEGEKKYWEKPLPGGKAYWAYIDTTFALYRPGIFPENETWFSAIRLAPPYTARHLPWYVDPDSMTDEDFFYQRAVKCLSSVWSVQDLQTLKKENMRLQSKIHELEKQVELLQQSFDKQFALIAHKSLKYIKNIILRQ